MILEELRNNMKLYVIQPVSSDNIEDVFNIMIGNEYYYSRTQNHELTIKECIDEIDDTPPNTSFDKKTYVIIYKNNRPIGLVDFVEGYPDENTGYLGLFMLSTDIHRKGLGRDLLKDILSIARNIGLSRIELACYEVNHIGLSFWNDIGFKEIRKCKRINDGVEYSLISMEIEL